MAEQPQYGILRTLPPPKRTPQKKLLMARFFYDDSSHDLLGPGKSFDNWGDNYKTCLANLFPGIPIANDNVGPSDNSVFKIDVTRRCQLVVDVIDAETAAGGAAQVAADAAAQAAAANNTVDNNICPHRVRVETFPRMDNNPPFVWQNVDNFTLRETPEIPVLITPARFYDACSRTSQENVFERLIQWWGENVAPPTALEGIYPFRINLVDQGITSIDNSYLIVSIENINNRIPPSADNSLLVFVIQLGDIPKTIKFKLNRDNGCPEEENSGNYLLVGGKKLAKCFFEEIYKPLQ